MARAEFEESKHFGMNTLITHRVYGMHATECLKAVHREAERLEGLMSRFLPDSEISRLNRAAGMGWVKLSGETYAVLERAAAFSQLGGGLFDVTIGPLVSLWSGRRESGEPPGEAGTHRALSLVGHGDLLLDPGERSAMLRRHGQSVDLGGIGKGYAGDRFLEVFREYGVTSAFTNIGGNVAALGNRPDGSPWRVGIRHPRSEDGLIGLVEASGKAVVTSGDYQRYFIDGEGRRRHHILDPRTGYPAESGLIGVTVMAGSSMDADALSTMVFIAGLREGRRLLGRCPGAEAVIVDESLTVHVTAGLKDRFQAAGGIDVQILKG